MDEKNQKKDLQELLLELQNRNLLVNHASLDNFQTLEKEERVVYWGIDCTAPFLHFGHLLLIIQTFRFVEKGFRVIILFGGSTSKIGDPSDKKKEREKIATQIVVDNQVSLENKVKEIINRRDLEKKKYFSFSPLSLFFFDVLLKKIYAVLGLDQQSEVGEKWNNFLSLIIPNSVTKEKYLFLNNKNWLEKINHLDFLSLVGHNISVNYLLAKEWVKRRLKKELSYAAFSYSLLQAYDFYYLYKNFKCCGQISGSDQWGNITTGLKLIRNLFSSSEEKNKSFALSFPLLVNQKGEKFSKTVRNNSLFLTDGGQETFFDFFRNLTDLKAKEYIEKFTFLSQDQINRLVELNNPPKLRILQRILLELVWFLNYGEIESLKVITQKKSANN